MKISGIVATINNNIIALNVDGKSYVPHVNGYKFFPEEEQEVLLDFSQRDKKLFSSYIKNIPDGSVIVIGDNTLLDAFGLFKRILKDKTITFIVSNANEIKTITYLKNNWDKYIFKNTSYVRNLEKESSKKRLFNITKKEAKDNKSNVFIMGGKTVYETFSGKYNEFIVNNVNIQESVLMDMENNKNIDFNKVRL
jgi:dihydrofolate reductase